MKMFRGNLNLQILVCYAQDGKLYHYMIISRWKLYHTYLQVVSGSWIWKAKNHQIRILTTALIEWSHVQFFADPHFLSPWIQIFPSNWSARQNRSSCYKHETKKMVWLGTSIFYKSILFIKKNTLNK